MNIPEFYFRTLTVLFWSILLCNWIFIPNQTVNLYISNIYLILSLIYLALFIKSKTKNGFSRTNYLNKDYIDFFYNFISIIAFVVSMMYFLLYSNNIKLFLIKSLVIFMYLYISFQKVLKSKDENGVVGIISALLIFAFATCY